jgi:hypothetical protein
MLCEECPYPFCLKAEARAVNTLLHNEMARQVRQFSLTVQAAAERFDVSSRTIIRAINDRVKEQQCYWCLLDKYSIAAYCRPKYCTIARDDGIITVVLSRHDVATKHELKLIRNIVEDLFPYGVLRSNGNIGHDHWVVSNVSTSEANEVYARMEELSKYAPMLR